MHILSHFLTRPVTSGLRQWCHYVLFASTVKDTVRAGTSSTVHYHCVVFVLYRVMNIHRVSSRVIGMTLRRWLRGKGSSCRVYSGSCRPPLAISDKRKIFITHNIQQHTNTLHSTLPRIFSPINTKTANSLFKLLTVPYRTVPYVYLRQITYDNKNQPTTT